MTSLEVLDLDILLVSSSSLDRENGNLPALSYFMLSFCSIHYVLRHSSILTIPLLLIEIMAARRGMWTNVAKRLHKPLKIFPSGPDASELMLYGRVAYELHDGRKTEIDWAAHAQLVREEAWKFGLYQVYLVSYL